MLLWNSFIYRVTQTLSQSNQRDNSYIVIEGCRIRHSNKGYYTLWIERTLQLNSRDVESPLYTLCSADHQSSARHIYIRPPSALRIRSFSIFGNLYRKETFIDLHHRSSFASHLDIPTERNSLVQHRSVFCSLVYYTKPRSYSIIPRSVLVESPTTARDTRSLRYIIGQWKLRDPCGSRLISTHLVVCVA